MTTEEAFDTMMKCVKLYGAVCAITLGTVAVVAAAGPSVTTFMWVRAVLLLAITPVLYRMAARRRFERLRTVAVVLPVAIVGVDLIPGVCPVWYAGMQAIAALALVGVAFLTRGSALRTVGS
jgi:hypothetical protein